MTPKDTSSHTQYVSSLGSAGSSDRSAVLAGVIESPFAAAAAAPFLEGGLLRLPTLTLALPSSCVRTTPGAGRRLRLDDFGGSSPSVALGAGDWVFLLPLPPAPGRDATEPRRRARRAGGSAEAAFWRLRVMVVLDFEARVFVGGAGGGGSAATEVRRLFGRVANRGLGTKGVADFGCNKVSEG